MFFVPPKGRKSMKNQPKIVSTSILIRESKRASKNCPKNRQHGSNIGPSWGHFGFQNALGRVQERRKSDTENHTEKTHQKEP